MWIHKSFGHILLTSDGLHGSDPETVKKIVARSASIDRDLLSKLTTLSSLMGGRDNASGIAVKLEQFQPDEVFDGVRIFVSTAMDSIEIWFPSGELSDRQRFSASGETGQAPSNTHATLASKSKPTKRQKADKKEGWRG